MSILNPLFDAVAWIIMRIHAVLAHIFGPASGWSWGLSIVFLVVFLRLLMVPLFVKQVNSQRKMMALQPQIQELRKRYKGDKQRLNEETMKFYKENQVNPLGGCLPMIAQFPVFISLFQVLRAIAAWSPGHPTQFGLTEPVVQSARSAHIFTVLLSDKFLFMHPPASFTARSVILVTVLISACTTFLTMRQSTKRGLMNATPDPDNPMAQSQKYMMYIAPFFALTGLYWQYGLVIYWVTNNLWTMGQQHFMYRNIPVVGTAAGSATAPATPSRGAVAKPSAAKPSGAAKSSAGTAKPARAGGQPKAGAADGTGAQTGSRLAGRGLLRVGKAKAEPEPEPEPEPAIKVVRQQPVRQTRSKRSGKR